MPVWPWLALIGLAFVVSAVARSRHGHIDTRPEAIGGTALLIIAALIAIL